MAGKGHSNYAMHEYAILTKKLQPLHPNIIRVYDVKSSAHANYVIMELCCFSLDEMPQTFKDYLYEDKGSGSSADFHVRQLVINGLVQDILQGTVFLHSKEVCFVFCIHARARLFIHEPIGLSKGVFGKGAFCKLRVW